MWDHATGRSKGYGFVSIRTKEEAQTAIEKMHGQVIGSRRVRCGWAQHKQVRIAMLAWTSCKLQYE
jgi:nucleolysin TIA-1/TIAR